MREASVKFFFLFLLLFIALNIAAQVLPRDREFNGIDPLSRAKIHGFYKNGHPDSVWTFYNQDGTIWKKGTYKQCSFDLGYFKVISTKRKINWLEPGVEHGRWEIYHPNGKVKIQYNMKCGLKSGPEKHFDANGVLLSEVVYVNNEIVLTKRFHDNGTLWELKTYFHGRWEREEDGDYYQRLENSVVRFYDTGELELSYSERSGVFHGLYRMFGKDGTLLYEAFYEDGEMHGKELVCYENGMRRTETDYNLGKKSGQSVSYSPDGNVIKVQIWDNGILRDELK